MQRRYVLLSVIVLSLLSTGCYDMKEEAPQTHIQAEKPAEEKRMVFVDKHLELELREQLHSSGPLSREALETITSLELTQGEVAVLDDLKWLPNLKSLTIIDHPIRDIQGIRHARNLEFVTITNGKLRSIDGLEELSLLKGLELQNHEIDDISSLGGLTNMISLDLSGNQIHNIEVLSGFTRLNEVILNDNQITNLEPLSKLKNLEIVKADNNRISKIPAMSSYHKLANLSLNQNQIINIESLDNCRVLAIVSLNGNKISDVKPLSGLHPGELYLADNRITDISSLEGIKEIGTLDISNNPIEDYSPLTRMNIGKIVGWSSSSTPLFKLMKGDLQVLFTIEFPVSWSNQYSVNQAGDTININHRSDVEPQALFFSIMAVTSEEWKEYLQDMKDGWPWKKLGEQNGLVVVRTLPTELSYGYGHEDPEMIKLVEQYNKMNEDVTGILSSFKLESAQINNSP